MDVVFAPAADRQLSQLRVYDQRRIADGIRKHLVEADPRAETRRKFVLQPATEFADYELRVGEFRVFYRIALTETGEQVLVTVIGLKGRDRLIVEGEELEI